MKKMLRKYDLPKVPKLPTVSIILMIVFYLGGSILITLKGLPLLPIGIDIAVLLVCFLSYLLIIFGAFYYAYFEKVNDPKSMKRGEDK
jgi:hypothetical protein